MTVKYGNVYGGSILCPMSLFKNCTSSDSGIRCVHSSTGYASRAYYNNGSIYIVTAEKYHPTEIFGIKLGC